MSNFQAFVQLVATILYKPFYYLFEVDFWIFDFSFGELVCAFILVDLSIIFFKKLKGGN